jgi:hypothetical protein
MKHFFTAGIFFMVGLISFASAYFFRAIIPKNLNISITLLLVSITLVKMLDIRDQMFG